MRFVIQAPRGDAFYHKAKKNADLFPQTERRFPFIGLSVLTDGIILTQLKWKWKPPGGIVF
jgi:hypothetical protein